MCMFEPPVRTNSDVNILQEVEITILYFNANIFFLIVVRSGHDVEELNLQRD